MSNDADPNVVSRWIETDTGIVLSIETEGVEGEWIQSVDYATLDEWR